MNATEMLARLNAVEHAAAERENNEMKRKEARCLAGLKQAEALIQKLRDIRPVVVKLLELGVGYYDHGFWNEFLTDGVSHRWGFCKHNASFFGAEAGGCDGMFNLFLNIDNGRWTIKDPSLRRFVENRESIVEYSAEEIAEMASKPYIDMGRVIYNDLFFVLACANTMASGIEEYIVNVEMTVANMK